MFEAIQYLVSSKKLEDGFGMDNVTMVNGREKITRSCDDNMGLDLQFIQKLYFSFFTRHLGQLLWAQNESN